MSKSIYTINSWWTLKKAPPYARRYIGEKYQLVHTAAGVQLCRKGSTICWMTAVAVKDNNNITESEWNNISKHGYFWKDHPDGSEFPPPVAVVATSSKPPCNCDIKDLFWNGHKCGR